MGLSTAAGCLVMRDLEIDPADPIEQCRRGLEACRTAPVVFEYHYRGRIERPDGRGSYRWVEGWSENGETGGVLYPWMTRAEARQEAKRSGGRAVFRRA